MHSVVRYVSLLARVLDQHLEEVQAGLIVAQGLFGGLGVEHELAVILGVELHAVHPALIVAHSTVYEPVRKEVKGYVVDPLGKHHFDNVSIE